MSRCDSHAPRYPTPEGMPLEVVRAARHLRHLLEPGAACELEREHAGAHRSGGLLWHAPPVVVNRPLPDAHPVVFSWEPTLAGDAGA